ncbi:MAG TPA: polysulfide reductase NrfD [Syntrophorhabdaceae bacterium]|jgi:molybdopterin-containing oxidoreductase family membrane subunit|nr:polysulfide reductase NrfD [Syntrophorhabdaceae bacterium]HOS59315.1 polysulfide reductase NrfD [Syntrophorhabdaceae bacterium]HPL41038.1 polysulfide reductase NrfD [Syntrophorhabdaceae bacterium]
MLSKAFTGSKKYWMWIIMLSAIILAGFSSYLLQLRFGLGITGMSKNISWGLYISNFTFFVGVAASAVMVVLPYYLHNYKQFGKITVFGEFLAVASVVMTILFIFVDLGQPARALNIIRYASPKSLLFWDMIVLNMYLLMNIIIGWRTLNAERKSEPQPFWVKILILISIPWAISIHTVTAFIFSGLVARPFWLTAILAPRFLASAFASGPAILVLICFTMKRIAGFDTGREAIGKLVQIMAYAMIINIFLLFAEMFTVFYSDIPEHSVYFHIMFFGTKGYYLLSPFMWLSMVLAWLSAFIFINPETRKNDAFLIGACIAVIISVWIEKGLGLVISGFVPSPLGEITRYIPSTHEIAITVGIYAIGLLILTALTKIAISIKNGI